MTEIIKEWFDRLYADTGLNFSVFRDAFDAQRFLEGVLTTLEMSAICLALSLAIGVLGAAVQGVRFRPLAWLVDAYIQFFRNTPSVIQLYFFFFGLGPLFTSTNEFGQAVPLVSSYTWAVICFSIYAGAFNVEIFRSGIEAISPATVDAAQALGYTRLGTYVHVVLPLALRISFPALSNNMVNLVKLTSVAYAIAVPDILYASSQIWSDSLNVAEIMNVVLFSYVLIVSVFVWGAGLLERRLRVPGMGV